MILSDFDLRSYLQSKRLYVEPFDDRIVRENGLDLRIGNEYCELVESNNVFYIREGADISKLFRCGKANDYIVLKPNKRYLLHSLEYLKVPPELMGFVEIRSTFARLGIMMPPTIIDGGFEGQITIEVLSTSSPIAIPIGTRFLHVVFAKLTTPVTKPYRGKYQGQRGATLPRLHSLK